MACSVFEKIVVEPFLNAVLQLRYGHGVNDVSPEPLQVGEPFIEKHLNLLIVSGGGIGLRVERLANNAQPRAFQSVFVEKSGIGRRNLAGGIGGDGIVGVVTSDGVE
jgi:hypothetical protein